MRSPSWKHTCNVSYFAGIVDSSGIRFFYTEQLRSNDAGVLRLGHSLSPVSIVIPQNQTSFPVRGDCSNDCLEQV